MATMTAAVDLAHKAAAGTEHLHARPGSYAFVVILLSAAWTAAILATRSLSLALGGGVVVGGAIANLASLAIWSGVPNPIVAERITFNLADVFVVVGFVFVAVAVLGLAARSPDRLHEPVSLRP
jgi:hypothetical protein